MTDTIYVHVYNFMQQCNKANLALRISFGSQHLNNILNFLLQKSERNEKVEQPQKLILPGTHRARFILIVPVRRGQAKQWRQALTDLSASSQSCISSACHIASEDWLCDVFTRGLRLTLKPLLAMTGDKPEIMMEGFATFYNSLAKS